MKTEIELKEIVKEKYASIAEQSLEENQSSCCGAGGCSTEVYNIMTDDYSNVSGYNKDAELGLGCGLPTQFARIKKGDTIVDLGSGAGNDCFVARAETFSNDANAQIQYKTLDGKSYFNSTEEVIMHCMNHGTYHRGQIITMLRQAGFTVVGSTDFIRFCRENA